MNQSTRNTSSRSFSLRHLFAVVTLVSLVCAFMAGVGWESSFLLLPMLVGSLSGIYLCHRPNLTRSMESAAIGSTVVTCGLLLIPFTALLIAGVDLPITNPRAILLPMWVAGLAGSPFVGAIVAALWIALGPRSIQRSEA